MSSGLRLHGLKYTQQTKSLMTIFFAAIIDPGLVIFYGSLANILDVLGLPNSLIAEGTSRLFRLLAS